MRWSGGMVMSQKVKDSHAQLQEEREKTQFLRQFGYNTLHLRVQTGGVIENTGEC